MLYFCTLWSKILVCREAMLGTGAILDKDKGTLIYYLFGRHSPGQRLNLNSLQECQIDYASTIFQCPFSLYKQLHVISALYGPQKQMRLLPSFLHLQIEDLRTYLPFAEHYIKQKEKSISILYNSTSIYDNIM